MISKLTQLLNYFGLYTSDQFIEQVELKGEALRYVSVLERAIAGMSDPAKPIIVMGHNTSIHDVALQHGQNIIVSPYARYTSIVGVNVLPKD